MGVWKAGACTLLAASLFAAGPVRADALDDVVRAEMARQHIPGVAVAVVRHGRILRQSGYGLANVEHGVRVTPLTRFQSASVGKTFTAALVLRLAEQGKLTLDDPIAEHLPGTPPAWAGIRIRHLLTHTSGLPPADEAVDLQREYTEDQLLASAYRVPMQAAPGERWSYSTLGYQVLGVLCSKLGGRFWGEQLRELVFAPAGVDARVMSERDIVPHRAAGYERVKGELKNQRWVAPSLNTTADGSLYLTAGDLARWAIALEDDRVLSRASREAMWTRAKLADGSAVGWGLGWKLDSFDGHRVMQHSGRWQGFSTHFAIYPDDRLAVAVLVNRSGADALTLLDRIAGQYVPALRPRAARPLDRQAYARAPIHVRGSMNDWSTSAPLRPAAAGLWEAELALEAGTHRFKIASEDWQAMDLGARFDESATAPGEAKPLEARGADLEIDVRRPGTYVFTLDARRPATPRLTVRAR